MIKWYYSGEKENEENNLMIGIKINFTIISHCFVR